jgi:ribitol-5-phosphate 2-dehydrogenase
MKTKGWKAIQLTKPYRFKSVYKEEIVHDDDVIITPKVGCICAADLRYYTGNRRKKALKRKLPMSLLHEGIGVVSEASNQFEKGDRVIIVPNIPGYLQHRKEYPTSYECCVACQNGVESENHCQNVHFLSSGYDGMTQEYVVMPKECVVKIPDNVPDEIAVLAELTTVAMNACKKLEKRNQLNKDSKVVIFGDGVVGYAVYAVLSHIYGIKKDNLYVIGMDKSKLSHFKHAKKRIFGQNGLPDNYFDLMFECVGGNGITGAVDRGIEILLPLGTIMLMGVSEQDIPINTRDILEKGLSLAGSSRSNRKDYSEFAEYIQDKRFQKILGKMNSGYTFKVKKPTDLNRAFDFAASKDYWGKIYLQLNRHIEI